jgi:protein-S-isoprenylcysteine O-methyltransferase Ste14
MGLLRWLDVAGVMALMAATAAFGPRNPVWLLLAGLSLALVSWVFWLAARLQLGSSFARQVEVRRLVTTGLYSKLRHPIYVFVGLAFLGLIVAWQEWDLLAVWVIAALVLFLKSRREEQTLIQAYGAEYLEYRRRTWF